MSFRVTNNSAIERTMRDLSASGFRRDRVQAQISSGRKILKPHDDPTGNARGMVLRTQLAQNEQYLKNIQSARAWVQTTDSSLGTYTDILQRMRNLTVQGASGNLANQDRAAIVNELDQIREEIRALGNTQYAGRYIFGGIKTDQEPYPTDITLSPNDQGSLQVEISPSVTVPYNVTGVALFGDTTTVNNVYDVIDELSGFLTQGTQTEDISRISILRIDGMLDRAKAVRTNMGGLMNRLDLTEARFSDISVSLDNLRRETEDVDVAEASLLLNQNEATFRAALSVGSRAIPLSLVDFLR